MAKKTKAEAESTREAILEAAARVFYDRGVSKASLEEIAEAAGVTRGAIYWHFKNKTDVFLALYERLHVPFTEMVLEDLERDHPDPLRQLEELCVQLLYEVEENEQKRMILTILLVRCEYSGEMAQVLTEQSKRRKEKFKLFDQYFGRAKEKGHLAAEADPQVLTLSLFCYLGGIVLESIRDPQTVNLKKLAVPLMSQFFSQLT